jgi:hypothetical protein
MTPSQMSSLSPFHFTACELALRADVREAEPITRQINSWGAPSYNTYNKNDCDGIGGDYWVMDWGIGLIGRHSNTY